MGLMVGAEMVKDRSTKEKALDWRNNIIRGAYERGLLVLGCGQNTVRFCPALTVSDSEIDVALSIFEEAVREAVNHGNARAEGGRNELKG
jgi:4-aminobutyrate aminotransferase